MLILDHFSTKFRNYAFIFYFKFGKKQLNNKATNK